MNQDLVYWGNPEEDGTGGFTFDAPIEIKGRCRYKVQQVVSGLGEEKVSRATVHLDQEVDEGGYLYLGTLADSNIGDDQTPKSTEGSMRILSFDNIPRLEGPGSLYKAYCNMD